MTKQHAKAGTPSHEAGRVDPAVTTGDSAVFSSLIEPYRRELLISAEHIISLAASKVCMKWNEQTLS